MKKLLVTIFCLVALSVAAVPAGAQTRSRRARTQTVQTTRYGYYDYQNNQNQDWRYEDRSFWEAHRDKITTAAGAGAGALVGALIGGKKGAIIGAIAGGGGAALYTYGIRDKNDRYRY
jgi:hypothetical protein